MQRHSAQLATNYSLASSPFFVEIATAIYTNTSR